MSTVRKYALYITVIAIIAPATQAFAYCPRKADNLQSFWGCMVPMRGTIGVQYTGTAFNLDPNHRAMMQMVQTTPAVARPVVYPYVQTYYNPYGAVTSSLMYWATMGAWANRNR